MWAAAWFWWFRDDPHDAPRRERRASCALIGHGRRGAHARVPWRALLRSRTMVALCAMYFGAIYGWYFYLTWLPTYLLRARGFDLHAVGWLAALPLLGIAAGVLLGGWLERRPGAPLGRAGRPPHAGPGRPAARRAGDPRRDDHADAAPRRRCCLAAAAGLAALGVAPAWAVCLDIGGRHAGVVSGAMNTFGNLGGALSPLVVGWCLDALAARGTRRWRRSPCSICVAAAVLAGHRPDAPHLSRRPDDAA